MLGGTLLVVCFHLNTLFLLFFPVSLVIGSATPILLHCHLEKHHSHFAFSFLTTVDLFYCLFWGFWTLNTYTVPCLFVERIQKRNCYLSASTLKSKNISGTLFLVCLSLHMFFIVFSALLTWKCINRSYVVPNLHSKYSKDTLLLFAYNC